jgi:hypothetical protein
VERPARVQTGNDFDSRVKHGATSWAGKRFCDICLEEEKSYGDQDI